MKMSGLTSPKRFSGTYDQFYSGNHDYEPDISNQMKVPKRIRVTGDNDDDPSVNWARINGSSEKFEMNVPDRIVVAGGEQHIGTRGIPREVELEKSIMPHPDPTFYRVQTPPRTITLDNYQYPAVDELEPLTPNESKDSPTSNHSNHRNSHSHNSYIQPLQDSGTPGVAHTELSPGEEMSLLRRQVARLNRRVMALELDSQQRSHREVITYTLGVVYFLIKAFVWINKH